MRKNQSNHPQPVMPEDLQHIADLVERDNKGTEVRCANYRRRAKIRRFSFALCLFAITAYVSITAYSNPPLYSETKVHGNIDSNKASEIAIDMFCNK